MPLMQIESYGFTASNQWRKVGEANVILKLNFFFFFFF